MKPIKCKVLALAISAFATGISYLEFYVLASCLEVQSTPPVCFSHCHPEIHIESKINKVLRPVPWEKTVMDE